MKPNFCSFDRPLPCAGPRVNPQARNKSARLPGGAPSEGSNKGLAWSTGHPQLQATSSRRVQHSGVCFVSRNGTLSASSQASIATRLIVPELKLQFGERIKCVGQSAELGSWYLNAAPILSWTEGDNWVHHLQLPPGSHEFKLLIARDDGTTHWEQGNNRKIEVPESIDGILEVKCAFEKTDSTDIAKVPRSVREQDQRAIKVASSEASNGARQSSRGFFGSNNIVAGDVPDALEGDSADREPDNLGDAKKTPSYDWGKKDDKEKYSSKEEALEGVNPPSSDPLKETEPGTDDKSVKPTSSQWARNGSSRGSDSRAWNRGQFNGSSNHQNHLNGVELNSISKNNFQANGKTVEMYGGAEAKELEDGSVLVKFPADDSGEDILKLVQRLLGDKINLD